MNEIDKLSYSLEINFINKSGMDSSILIKFNDSGLKVKRVIVGNVCITEEAIKGRVLSGRIDNKDGYCGYRYDYENGENLLNINPNVPINTAVTLINKSKGEVDFLTAELVLSSIVRNDYRVLILNDGNLNIIKTIFAESEKTKLCLKEFINLSKLEGDKSFIETDKKRVYTINDELVDETQLLEDGDIKTQLSSLSSIISMNPQNYKELIDIKNKIQKKHIKDSEKI